MTTPRPDRSHNLHIDAGQILVINDSGGFLIESLPDDEIHAFIDQWINGQRDSEKVERFRDDVRQLVEGWEQ